MRTYIAILFFSILGSVKAQDILVLDAETEQPLQGVLVYNKSNTILLTTNAQGIVNVERFRANEIIVFNDSFYNQYETSRNELELFGGIVYLTAYVEGLDEVVVSVSRFKQEKRDVPQRIVSVSADVIQLTAPQTSADLLQQSGNVYIQKSQLGGGSPMIRGLSTNRLLITVDGVRMNNAIFRGGNLQNVISIDPLSVQNTEVILGAGSVIYGSDAIGGVMGFYTLTPQTSYQDSLFVKANAMVRYASANQEKTAHADVNLGFKKWAFLSSFSYSYFDDLRMGKHGPNDYLRPEYVQTINGQDTILQNGNPRVQVPTGYQQYNFMQKARYEAKDNLFFDLGLIYTTTSEYPRYDRLLRYRGDQLRSAQWYYGPQNWLMGHLKLTKLSSNSTFYNKIQASLAYQTFKESRNDRDYQSVIKHIRKERVDAVSATLDMEKILSTKTELSYGLEYVYNKVQSTGTDVDIEADTAIETVSRYPDGSTWESYAVYAHLKYKPNPRFVLQSGLRYNHILSNSDFTKNNQYLSLPFDNAKLNTGALTGTFGFNWLPAESLAWRFNFATAFRAPNIDDIGKVFDSEPGSVVVPNKDLKPEYAYGGELGLRYNLSKNITLDLVTYYTFIDDALVRRDYQLEGQSEILYDGEPSNVQAIQNAAKAWIYGFEAGIVIDLPYRFTFNSKYNIVKGTEEDDSGLEVPVRHAPPAFGNTHLIWKHKALTLDAFVVFNGEFSHDDLTPSEASKDYIYAKDQNGNPYVPSWYTLNLRSRYQFDKNTTITLSMENITDQRYRPYSSGISAPGRNFIIALKYSI